MRRKARWSSTSSCFGRSSRRKAGRRRGGQAGQGIHARRRPRGDRSCAARLPFTWDVDTLSRGLNFTLTTTAGASNPGRDHLWRNVRGLAARYLLQFRASVHRHQPLQLLEPVLHQDQVRRRAAVGCPAAPLRMIDEPSVAGDVVRAGSGRQNRSIAKSNNGCRTPGDERRPGLHRRPQTSAGRPLRRTAPGRRATRVGDGRRPSRSVADLPSSGYRST